MATDWPCLVPGRDVAFMQSRQYNSAPPISVYTRYRYSPLPCYRPSTAEGTTGLLIEG